MIIDRKKIEEAKQSLGEKQADIIAELWGMQQYDERRHVACCPVHDDSTPSCSYDPKRHVFKCFGCDFHTDIIDTYIQRKNMTFAEACRELFKEADILYDFSELGTTTKLKVQKPLRFVPCIPEQQKVYDYWATRGISKETIDYLKIQADGNGKTCFLYYDLNDVLVDIKERESQPFTEADKRAGKSKVKHKYRGTPYANVLYNINQINTGEPLIITEGEGDCATAIECGFRNATSMNGGDQNLEFISECWDWLEQFSEIILVHDNDEPGRKACRQMVTRLGEYRCKVVDIPLEAPDENGELQHIKDLNDLLRIAGRDAVIEVMRNAREMEIPSVVDFTDVQRFDMSDVPGIETGFKELDDALDKLYLGSTTILTGTPGSGKSSLVSTLVCRAVDQGFPAFVYSGEIGNESLKSWINSCFAGRFGINQYQKANGHGVYYKVKEEVFKKINETYRGQIFLYKDTMEQKIDDIFNAAEGVVRRNGVKLLVFDNMSSVDLQANSDDKWFKQEEFVRRIINFANRWDVCCIAVLHPKKMLENKRMNMYDLSGTSAAINLSQRILALYRVTPKEKMGVMNKFQNGCRWQTEPIYADVIIDILKDRYGSGGNQSVELFYDVPSRRFYDTPENLHYIYGWDDQRAEHMRQPLPFGLSTPELIEAGESEIFGTISP